jgi:hypothetical protein
MELYQLFCCLPAPLPQEVVREERSAVEECGRLPVVALCPARQGGPLDYPGLAAASAATVTDRWQLCLHRVLPGTDRDDLPTRETQDDFFASVSESVAKLLLHLAWLTETGVRAGALETLTGAAGGLALVRNRLWHYNQVGEVSLTPGPPLTGDRDAGRAPPIRAALPGGL